MRTDDMRDSGGEAHQRLSSEGSGSVGPGSSAALDRRGGDAGASDNEEAR